MCGVALALEEVVGGFVRGVVGNGGEVPDEVRVGGVVAGGVGFAVGDFVVDGEDGGEGLVELLDERGLGAEVGGEVERGEGELAEAAGAEGIEEAGDLRLAEEVDGLLGVADEEDGLAMTVPRVGEEANEFVLGGGGVLHLVDEEVIEAGAGGGGEVVESGIVAEGGERGEGELGEVAGGGGLEDELELDEGVAEDAEESLGDEPLLLGVADGRQIGEVAEGFAEGRGALSEANRGWRRGAACVCGRDWSNFRLLRLVIPRSLRQDLVRWARRR